MLEDHQRKIQAAMDRLWNELQWRKIVKQLEKEMKKDA
jgi:hypothetical protein